MERVSKTDYLMAHDGKMYFHSQRKNANVGEIAKDAPQDLIAAFFGAVADKAKLFDCDCGNVSFEIVFVSGQSKKVVVADVVDYGCQYSLEKVREAVQDAFPFRARSRKMPASRQKFKRTVVIWDGAMIKRGIDGVTYVPRTPPPAAYYDYGGHFGCNYYGSKRVSRPFHGKRWQHAEQTRDQWQSLMKAYMEKIDNIIKNGTLYFRTKLAKRGELNTDEAMK